MTFAEHLRILEYTLAIRYTDISSFSPSWMTRLKGNELTGVLNTKKIEVIMLNWS